MFALSHASPGAMSTALGPWEKEEVGCCGGKTDAQLDIHVFTALLHYPLTHSFFQSLIQPGFPGRAASAPSRHSRKTGVSKAHPSPCVVHITGQWLTSSF